MIRKKRMSKGIAKILSGLLVFGMVAGVVPAVPHGTLQVQAANEHSHPVCGSLFGSNRSVVVAVLTTAPTLTWNLRN